MAQPQARAPEKEHWSSLDELSRGPLQQFEMKKDADGKTVLSFNSRDGRIGLGLRTTDGSSFPVFTNDVRAERITNIAGENYNIAAKHQKDGSIAYTITLSADTVSSRIQVGNKSVLLDVNRLHGQREALVEKKTPAATIPASPNPVPVPDASPAPAATSEPQHVPAAAPAIPRPSAEPAVSPTPEPAPATKPESPPAATSAAQVAEAAPPAAVLPAAAPEPAAAAAPSFDVASASPLTLPPRRVSPREAQTLITSLGLRTNGSGTTYSRAAYPGKYTVVQGSEGMHVRYENKKEIHEYRAGKGWQQVTKATAGREIPAEEAFAACREHTLSEGKAREARALVAALKITASANGDHFQADASHRGAHPGSYYLTQNEKTSKLGLIYAGPDGSVQSYNPDTKKWTGGGLGAEHTLVSADVVRRTEIAAKNSEGLALMRKLGLHSNAKGTLSRPGYPGTYDIMVGENGQMFCAYHEKPGGPITHEFHGRGWVKVGDDTWGNWFSGIGDRAAGRALKPSEMLALARGNGLSEQERAQANALVEKAKLVRSGDHFQANSTHRKEHPNNYYLQLDPKTRELSLFYSSGVNGESSQTFNPKTGKWANSAPLGHLVSAEALDTGSSVAQN